MALSLTQKIVQLHTSLSDSDIPHAFGGALALAYCTRDPRATNDIDVNIFVSTREAGAVLDRLPTGIAYDDGDVERIRRDGQARLWWTGSPVDVFFSNHPFHDRARERCRTVPFAGIRIPVLDCTDLAIFKAFFARDKDWIDIKAMASAGTIDGADAVSVIGDLLAPDHPSSISLRDALDLD